MTATSRHRGRRAVLVTLAAVSCALGLFPGIAAASRAAPGAAAGTAALGAGSTLWPANPDWQRYVEAPASRDVHPVSVVSTSGQVTGADALT
ncbi:MAG: hypothetical protein ABSF03_21540, partial [Streptosporangiaceae bacterium]